MTFISQDTQVFIQGAGRGIGLAFVEELLANSQGKIHASYRSEESKNNLQAMQNSHNERLRIYHLDVTDEKSVRSCSDDLAKHTSELHLLVNCSGILHDSEMQPEKKLEDINMDFVFKGFAVNTFSIMLMAKHFHRFFHHRSHAVWANISARVGSIEDNRLGGWYTYRASKAAQNMITKNMALEFKRIAKTTVCVALHPGTVATQLSEPFVRNSTKRTVFPPQKCAQQLLDVIYGLTLEDSAKFFAWDGSAILW
ncbi:SDR family NAD(P)-dependent oxidoreductase [Candidatus Uabimicrobium amorphum]|uniref:SDR family oxidoreductase n=1 Tax=Uabimicrobium amorphum TaxID=2596890 RepID=A0A5S9F3X4_UABAM|nr:SDR family NAD(P)-dependent oxidoreductase [Candidatus Uabimicrobium amorphum]BBM85205.1 SDR family oxidoreductase [Candidatus Uabimicrobium amorphum]